MTTTMPRHRPSALDRARRLPWLPIGVGLAVVLAGLSLYLYATKAEDRATVATTQAKVLADPILELCAAGGNVARALADDGKCGLAQQVQNQPEPLADPVDRATVANLVRDEVAKIRLPAGQGPSADQILAAARTVIEANPERFRGADGLPGRNGSDVTGAMVAAAVNAYFEANPPQPGPRGAAGERGEEGQPGKPGADGPKGDDAPRVTAVTLVRTDPAEPGSCVMRVTTEDGKAYDAPADPAVCPAPPGEPAPTPGLFSN